MTAIAARFADYAHQLGDDGKTTCGLDAGVMAERYGQRPLCPRCRVIEIEKAA